MLRPLVFQSGVVVNGGPYNTQRYNTIRYDGVDRTGTGQLIGATDDLFKRCLTWNFFKGDGFQFDCRWLKRRIMRFLLGVDGVSFNVDQTYQISVLYGPGDEINITVLTQSRTIVRSAGYNGFGYNAVRYDEVTSTTAPLPIVFDSVNLMALQAGINSGVLQLPFQFTYSVNIGIQNQGFSFGSSGFGVGGF